MIIHSRYTISPDRNRMPCHEPYTALRLVTEFLLRVPCARRARAWDLFYRLLKAKTRYIDDLDGFTFMMDGTVRAKEIATSLGFKWKSIQQTFIIPVAVRRPRVGDCRPAPARLSERVRRTLSGRERRGHDDGRPLHPAGRQLPHVRQQRHGRLRGELRLRDEQ